MKGLFRKMVVGVVTLSLVCGAFLYVPAQAKAKHTVTFMYGTKVNTQVVPDGGNAIVPIDTGVEGFTFLGWTDSCMNVRADKLILGMYVSNTPYATATNSMSSVKKINDNTSAPFLPWWDGTKGVPGVTCVVRWYNGHNNELWKTEVVPYGSSLPDPEDPCMDHLEFVGWEGSWKNITEDRAIKAWYYETHQVKFRDGVEGDIYDVQWVRHGEGTDSKPPFHRGWSFKKYDRSISCITEDMEVTAIYEVF